MNLNKRLSELETIADRTNSDYEKGAWIIYEYEDGSCRLSSARLGNHDFENEQQMQKFIDEHHKGTPNKRIGFIRVSFVNEQCKPPKEL